MTSLTQYYGYLNLKIRKRLLVGYILRGGIRGRSLNIYITTSIYLKERNEKKMNKELRDFHRLIKLRNSLKKVTQLSFNISTYDKTYPLDSMDPSMYNEHINVMKDLLRETVEYLGKSLEI